VSPPLKPGEDPEIRALLKKYMGAKNSDPPPPDTNASEAKLIAALVAKTESLERTRQDLAGKLGASIRDSGTFTQFGQDQVDNMMLRTENTRLQKENDELKAIIKTWTDRKNEWTVRIILGFVATLALYVWTLVTASRNK
jgi:hypothetical protein